MRLFGMAVAIVAAYLISQAPLGDFAPAPTQYSLTVAVFAQDNEHFQDLHFYGDGSITRIDVVPVPGATQKPHGYELGAMHIQQNSQNSVVYYWGAASGETSCKKQPWVQAELSNPFAFSTGRLKVLTDQWSRKQVGSEVINGRPANIFVFTTPKQDRTIKDWIDSQYGLDVKIEEDGKLKMEVTKFDLAKPPASVFVLDPVCK
jgi:hypothetical protein